MGWCTTEGWTCRDLFVVEGGRRSGRRREALRVGRPGRSAEGREVALVSGASTLRAVGLRDDSKGSSALHWLGLQASKGLLEVTGSVRAAREVEQVAAPF